MTSFATLDHAPLTTTPGAGIEPDGAPRPRRRSGRIADPARERRVNLDGLAIGAPLSAAFVGVLLAGVDVAAAHEGAAADADVTPAHPPGSLGPVVQVEAATPAPLAAAVGDTASLASGAASASGSPIDPVAATETAALGIPALERADGMHPVATSDAAAGMPPTAAPGVGLSINIGGGASAPGASASASAGEQGTGGSTIGTSVVGSDGDDVIHGTPYDDNLRGGDGDDTIYGYAGDDQLFGEAGDDTLDGGEGDDLLDGGIGDDLLHGGPGDDRLLGAEGNDQLDGEAGIDWLDGGEGDDVVDGGEDNDRLLGGTGDDVLVVDDIHDIALEYGRGADDGGVDLLQVGPGFADDLPPGTDAATFVFSEHLGIALPEGTPAYRQQVGLEIEHLTLQGTANHGVIGDGGDNQLTGNAGDNALYGMAGDDLLVGNGGRDLLDGGAGSDRLEGGGDDDILRGGDGADEIHGGGGDDVLAGGLGADRLYGEAGDDTYVLRFDDNAVESIFDQQGVNQLTLDPPDGALVQTAIDGDDLLLVVNHNTLATIDGYVGGESQWAGIDLGDGVVGFDGLMAASSPSVELDDGTDVGSSQEIGSASADDLLGAYLSEPSGFGTAGVDDMVGSPGADWLVGLEGDDHLQGGDGPDVLEGDDGSDLLEGGEGDDRYLFKTAQNGVDTIHDGAGANMAELQGFEGKMAAARVIDGDLMVVVDHAAVFTVDDFANNPDSFQGIQLGDTYYSTEDLLSS